MISDARLRVVGGRKRSNRPMDVSKEVNLAGEIELRVVEYVCREEVEVCA